MNYIWPLSVRLSGVLTVRRNSRRPSAYTRQAGNQRIFATKGTRNHKKVSLISEKKRFQTLEKGEVPQRMKHAANGKKRRDSNPLRSQCLLDSAKPSGRRRLRGIKTVKIARKK
jgi:hypothetical protein